MLALLSVYNKNGIVEFARELKDLRWDLLSSGGTAKVLREAGLEVRDVADLVGGGAILGHKVVTLSREVHAGLLADYGGELTMVNAERAEEKRALLDAHPDLVEFAEKFYPPIPFINLVCVDMYPLTDEIAKPDSTSESVRASTDIGGPTMLRAAAKGRRIVICEADDRMKVINWLKNDRPDEEEFITHLVAKAEFAVANYVMASAEYHGDGKYVGFSGSRAAFCKYGENAWQIPAALYSRDTGDPLALDRFKLVAGTAPSYNNWTDLDRMLQTMTHIAETFDDFDYPVNYFAEAVKHGNACGAAYGNDKIEVIQKTVIGDKKAIFGGLVILNFEVDENVAEELLTYGMDKGSRRMLDGIVAPSFTPEAIEMLKRKGDKCRFLANKALANLGAGDIDQQTRFRMVRGGILVQPNYTFVLDLEEDPEVEYLGEIITLADRANLRFAWAIGATSNSNTVTLVKDSMLIGNGVGQQDRVGGCELAVKRAHNAGHDTRGAVAYSDSFFPFNDGPGVLSQAGVTVVLASSGSVKDKEIVEYCNGLGITMFHIPDAKARGFFGH